MVRNFQSHICELMFHLLWMRLDGVFNHAINEHYSHISGEDSKDQFLLR